jgi:hypothetical protein
MKFTHRSSAVAVGLAACLLSPVELSAQRSWQTQAAVQLPVNIPRFAVVASPTTVQAGAVFRVRVSYLDGTGSKTAAPADVDVLLTLTTLSTMLEAKRASAGGASPAGPLESQKLTLPAAQPVLQVRAIFPRGRDAAEFSVTSNRVGDVRVFVESVGGGQRVQPGSALVTVARDLEPLRKREGPDVLRISWQPPVLPDAMYLRFKDSGQDVVRRGRELVRPFFVALELVEHGEARPVLPPDGRDLAVDLTIVNGHGRFDKQSLVIPADSVNSRESAELLSSTGGTIEMTARSLRRDVREARGSFTFEPGARATRLDIRPLSDSALANGLDPIAVEVTAVFEENGRKTIMKAEDEGLAERSVTFRFAGGSAHLKGGATWTRIPSKDSSIVVEMVANGPARNLVIQANSGNGLGEPIAGEARVSFKLPWWQLACAVIGGMLIPIVRRARAQIAIGALAGTIFYVAAFFGALATGQFNLGAIAIVLTKLPTENILAALVLGIVGYLALKTGLQRRRHYAPPKAAAV